MRERNLLKIISVIIILIIIIIIILLSIISGNNKVNVAQNETETLEIEDSENNNFYTAEMCIKDFLQYCQIKEINIEEYAEVITKEERLQYVYDMLDKEYIKNNNIKIDNIEEKIKLYTEDISFQANTVNQIQNTNIYSTYTVYGKLKKQENFEKISDLYFIVYLDKNNRTFSVIPIDDKSITDINQIQAKELNYQIEKNDNNSYLEIQLTDNKIAERYFEEFKNMLLYQVNEAYTMLDEEYKKYRFTNEDYFTQYVESNKTYFETIQIVNYNIEKNDKYILYTCKDQYGNIYIFKETEVMKYTVMLDDYTLKNEKFDEKYEKVSNRDKAILNINKFFEMINMQDYTSAYSLLDESFKQNYFKTQTEFENYIKTKTFRYNSLTYKEYNNEISSLHIYKILLKDATEQNTNEYEFNIIVKLLEETNFVISFKI